LARWCDVFKISYERRQQVSKLSTIKRPLQSKHILLRKEIQLTINIIKNPIIVQKRFQACYHYFELRKEQQS
jgi:hypothetical protein